MTANWNMRAPISAFAADLPLAAGLVALDVFARLLPHAPNFTPIAASAVFAGMMFRSRALALSIPLAAMLIADLVIGGYDWRVMIAVYAALMLPALLGVVAQRFRTPLIIAPAVVTSSVIFFVVTNFAVWAWSGMYPLTISGLVHCYVAALPFFQNTISGDMFWGAVLFGGWWLTRHVGLRLLSTKAGTSVAH
jgi:hypothetical protein